MTTFLHAPTRSRAIAVLIGWCFAGLAGQGLAQGVGVGKPGDFQLLRSADDPICQVIAKVISSSKSRKGLLDFGSTPGHVNWVTVPIVPAGSLPVRYIDIDVDGDGTAERVFNVAWSLSSEYTHALYVQRLGTPREPVPQDREAMLAILKTAKPIEFFGVKSGSTQPEAQTDWQIIGHVAIDGLQIQGRPHFIAWNYLSAPSELAQAYVFRIGHDAQAEKICMFGRICPCSGCKGNRSRMEGMLLPAREYCA